MSKYDMEKSQQTGPKFGWRAVSVVFGGFLCHLALGSMYTFGNFTPYIMSYIRNRTDDVTTRNVDASWLPILAIPGYTIGMTGGGLLDVRFGPQVATLIGSLVFSGSIILTCLTVRWSLIWYFFSFGLLLTFGMPCAYGPPIQTAMKWFPKRPGLVGGLVVAGFGGGATIFNQVLTQFINPDNISPDLLDDDGDRYFTDPDLLDRVPYSFLLLGGIYLVMLLFGVFLIRLPPKPDTCDLVGMEGPAITISSDDFVNGGTRHSDVVIKDGLSLEVVVSDKGTDGEKETTVKTEVDEPPKQIELSAIEAVKLALRTRSFYVVWLNVLGITAGMNMFINLYKAYGQTFISDDHFLALVGSLSSVFNCIGRPTWGFFMDKFGYRAAMMIISAGLATLTGTVVFTEDWDKAFFLVWICAMYFMFCGLWSITPSALSKLFGTATMSINYGIVFAAISAGNTIASVSALTLKESIGWHGLIIISTSLAALPFFLTFFFNGKDLYGRPI